MRSWRGGRCSGLPRSTEGLPGQRCVDTGSSSPDHQLGPTGAYARWQRRWAGARELEACESDFPGVFQKRFSFSFSFSLIVCYVLKSFRVLKGLYLFFLFRLLGPKWLRAAATGVERTMEYFLEKQMRGCLRRKVRLEKRSKGAFFFFCLYY